VAAGFGRLHQFLTTFSFGTSGISFTIHAISANRLSAAGSMARFCCRRVRAVRLPCCGGGQGLGLEFTKTLYRLL
jgi:hypothetical protein